MFGSASGQQIEMELQNKEQVWREALFCLPVLVIGGLVYRLNQWLGITVGSFTTALEFYLVQAFKFRRWNIWQPTRLTTALVRDLKPGQIITASPLPPRCHVTSVKLRCSIATIHYTYAGRAYSYTFSAYYRVRLVTTPSL